MVSSVDPKVSLPAVGIGTTLPARVTRSPGTLEESATQRSAQVFVDSLPAEARGRIGRPPRENLERDQFDGASRSQEQRSERAPSQIENSPEAFAEIGDSAQEAYATPLHVGNFTLLQAQLSASELGENTGGLSRTQHSAYHDRYVSAGAQRGGEAAVREAQLRRDELQEKTIVVPPVLTALNMNA
ncbi:hypothetical protein [Terasakiella sp. SH-1]|uniref:hypothetical protein n=1 Tax=Terasakiella sp. SH-1 TaxID=2560057 RepID=UPI00107413AD|nr:hypothetical protein [Terasakiella sp. SH-1]